MLNVVYVETENYCGMGDAYVSRLRRAVQRNLSVPFRFLCLENFAPQLSGWWNKLRLFEPGALPEGDRILYLDLDTVILDDISMLSQYKGDFAILRDFYRDGKMISPAGYGSGVMMWRAGFGAHIWKRFVDTGMQQNHSGGDQMFIERNAQNADILQDIFPGVFFSYKVHGRKPGGRVCCFHGQPKPHEVDDAWVKESWNGDAGRSR